MKGNIVEVVEGIGENKRTCHYLTNPVPFEKYANGEVSLMYFGVRPDELGDRYVFLHLTQNNLVEVFQSEIGYGCPLKMALNDLFLVDLKMSKVLSGREAEFATERILFHYSRIRAEEGGLRPLGIN